MEELNTQTEWQRPFCFLLQNLKNRTTVFLFIAFLTGANALGQTTFTGDNLNSPIADNLPPINSEANSNLTGTIGTNYIIDNVTIDIIHTYDADLEIKLLSPDGTTLNLSINNGGGGNNYTNTTRSALSKQD